MQDFLSGNEVKKYGGHPIVGSMSVIPEISGQQAAWAVQQLLADSNLVLANVDNTQSTRAAVEARKTGTKVAFPKVCHLLKTYTIFLVIVNDIDFVDFVSVVVLALVWWRCSQAFSSLVNCLYQSMSLLTIEYYKSWPFIRFGTFDLWLEVLSFTFSPIGMTWHEREWQRLWYLLALVWLSKVLFSYHIESLLQELIDFGIHRKHIRLNSAHTNARPICRVELQTRIHLVK